MTRNDFRRRLLGLEGELLAGDAYDHLFAGALGEPEPADARGRELHTLGVEMRGSMPIPAVVWAAIEQRADERALRGLRALRATDTPDSEDTHR